MEPVRPQQERIETHLARLKACRTCPGVVPPPVTGEAVADAAVLLAGQAPGPRECEQGRPFVWTAGTTLFRWFASIGAAEDAFRQRVYMAAAIRCFPGKPAGGKGGDRPPSREEMANCRPWLVHEVELLRPRLVLPVGRLAIGLFLQADRLKDVVGRAHRSTFAGRTLDVIPLPHPSGLSTWHKTEPGRTLLAEALALVRTHEAWQATFPAAGR